MWISDEDRINLTHNASLIKKYKNLSVNEMLEAIKINPFVLAFFNNPPYEVQIAAVKENGNTIRCIKNSSYELQQVALKHSKDPILQSLLTAYLREQYQKSRRNKHKDNYTGSEDWRRNVDSYCKYKDSGKLD